MDTPSTSERGHALDDVSGGPVLLTFGAIVRYSIPVTRLIPTLLGVLMGYAAANALRPPQEAERAPQLSSHSARHGISASEAPPPVGVSDTLRATQAAAKTTTEIDPRAASEKSDPSPHTPSTEKPDPIAVLLQYPPHLLRRALIEADQKTDKAVLGPRFEKVVNPDASPGGAPDRWQAAYAPVRAMIQRSTHWWGEGTLRAAGQSYPVSASVHYYKGQEGDYTLDGDDLPDPSWICWMATLFVKFPRAAGGTDLTRIGNSSCLGDLDVRNSQPFFILYHRTYPSDSLQEFFSHHALGVPDARGAGEFASATTAQKWAQNAPISWSPVTQMEQREREAALHEAVQPAHVDN